MAIGRRLVADGVLAAAGHVARLRLDELAAVVAGDGVAVVELGDAVAVPPLPAAFRLTDDGVVVPLRATSTGASRAAGGGRGSGPVHLGTDTLPQPGDVFVVRTLDPALAGVLPGLGGLVAETGSVLSHLAILAREYGVPTVVGVAGATERFEAGDWVVVDGTTGEVSTVRAPAEEGAA
jgi:pyruvate,water dikinase